MSASLGCLLFTPTSSLQSEDKLVLFVALISEHLNSIEISIIINNIIVQVIITMFTVCSIIIVFWARLTSKILTSFSWSVL